MYTKYNNITSSVFVNNCIFCVVCVFLSFFVKRSCISGFKAMWCTDTTQFKFFCMPSNIQKNSTHLHLHPSFMCIKSSGLLLMSYYLTTRATTLVTDVLICTVLRLEQLCAQLTGSPAYYRSIVRTVLEGCRIVYIYDTGY